MADSVNRRDFLARTAVVPLGALGAGLGGASPAPAVEGPVGRVGGPKLKTSLNAYSFSKALEDPIQGRGPGMSLLDLLDTCAELGFDAIDPTGYFFTGYPKVPSDKNLNEFKRRAFQLGLDISGTGVRTNFATLDKAKRAADVQHVREWIECAARLGAPVLRLFAGPQPPGTTFDQVAGWMVDDLRKCVEHGEKFGVLVGVQNHGDILKTADDLLKIVRLVDSPWFGVIVDTGNFPASDPYGEIARVIPHAVNWQIKELVDGAAGHSRIDLKRLVRVVREGGYRGYLPIETLAVPGGATPYDPRARVTALLADLREALQATEHGG